MPYEWNFMQCSSMHMCRHNMSSKHFMKPIARKQNSHILEGFYDMRVCPLLAYLFM